jgi:hypothetical protein
LRKVRPEESIPEEELAAGRELRERLDHLKEFL